MPTIGQILKGILKCRIIVILKKVGRYSVIVYTMTGCKRKVNESVGVPVLLVQ
jgi:hypothetical protein